MSKWTSVPCVTAATILFHIAFTNPERPLYQTFTQVSLTQSSLKYIAVKAFKIFCWLVTRINNPNKHDLMYRETVRWQSSSCGKWWLAYVLCHDLGCEHEFLGSFILCNMWTCMCSWFTVFLLSSFKLETEMCLSTLCFRIISRLTSVRTAVELLEPIQ